MEFDNHCLLKNDDGNDIILIPGEEHMNKSLTSLACLYSRYVTSVQTLCNQIILIGDVKVSDIAYCGDVTPKSGENVYLFQYDMQMFGHIISDLVFKFGYDIHLFYIEDRYKNMNQEFEKFSKLHQRIGKLAYKSYIVPNALTLNDWMTELGHPEIEILPITISEDRLPVMEEIIGSGAILYVKMLMLRLWYPVQDFTIDGLVRRLNILRSLHKKGFRIFWYDKSFRCASKTRRLNGCYTVCMVRNSGKSSIKHEESELFALPSIATLKSIQEYSAADIYQIYISTIQYQCRQIVRFGTTTDGGWDVCLDKPYRPSSQCLVYSFGIKDNWSFDEEIATAFDCKVFSLDPSLDLANHTHSPGVRFYRIGISADDTTKQGEVVSGNGTKYRDVWTLRSFKTIINHFGHSDHKIDILKMDVEFAEWEALPTMIATGLLKNVVQLYIEFHGNGDVNKLVVLRQLYDEGFRIFWMHRNPVEACRTKVYYSIYYTCWEVYFVKVK